MYRKKKTISRALVAGFAAALVGIALAGPAAAISHDDLIDMARVEQYLNDLTTVAARFMQVAPDGGLTTGSFYLSRPGKMRVEYDPDGRHRTRLLFLRRFGQANH